MPAGHAVPGVIREDLLARLQAQSPRKWRIAKQPEDGKPPRLPVVGVQQGRRRRQLVESGQSVDPGGDDGQSGRGSFQGDQSESLHVAGNGDVRHDQQVRAPVRGVQNRVGRAADHVDAFGQPLATGGGLDCGRFASAAQQEESCRGLFARGMGENA